MDAGGRDEQFPGVEDICMQQVSGAQQTERLQSLVHFPLGKAGERVAILGALALMLNQVRACFRVQRPADSVWLHSQY